MRIGIVIYGSIETVTGGFLYDKRLVEFMRKNGHHVDIISLQLRAYPMLLLHNLSLILAWKLTRPHYDLILQDGMNHPSLFLINKLLKQINASPIAAIVHQVKHVYNKWSWNSFVPRLVEKKYYHSVDLLIYNSKTTCSQIKNILSVPKPHIVAPPGGDRLGELTPDEIKNRAFRNGPLRLLFVGNLFPNKGLTELLDVLFKINDGSWRLSVVGSLALHASYVRIIKKKLNENEGGQCVTLAGTLIGSDLVSQYRNSQVFVLPFSREGFGIAYLEAMAYGLPVFGSTEGAVAEFIEEGINGYMISPGDNGKLTGSLEFLYRRRDKLAHMGLAALETYKESSKWRDSMDSIGVFLNQQLKGHRSETDE